MAHSFLEITPPTSYAQRTYIFDTTLYTYDTEGLLEKTITKHRDTTWFNPPGRIETSVTLGTSTTSYVNANGNLSSLNTTSETTTYSYQNGTIYSTKQSSIVNTSFEYTKKYPNKTDFANEAVLNELGAFGLQAPLNKNYKNLPDKIKETVTNKDATGGVTSSTNTTDVLLNYNSYKFIADKDGTKFIYNK